VLKIWMNFVIKFITNIKKVNIKKPRIEAEDSISEVEDRMVEINEAERRKELKEMVGFGLVLSFELIRSPRFLRRLLSFLHRCVQSLAAFVR